MSEVVLEDLVSRVEIVQLDARSTFRIRDTPYNQCIEKSLTQYAPTAVQIDEES
jgi:hypothetical protein